MDITSDDIKKVIRESIEEVYPGESKLTLSVAECAKVTGIGRHKITELIYQKNSDFPFFQVGTKFLINRDLLCKWLEKITTEHRQL